jgi:hypothetical protein
MDCIKRIVKYEPKILINKTKPTPPKNEEGDIICTLTERQIRYDPYLAMIIQYIHYVLLILFCILLVETGGPLQYLNP